MTSKKEKKATLINTIKMAMPAITYTEFNSWALFLKIPN